MMELKVEKCKKETYLRNFIIMEDIYEIKKDIIVIYYYLERCKAVGNTLRGYDQNNNTGALTLVDCSASSNYVNYYFKKAPTSWSHSFKNCTSTDSKNKDVITGAKTSGCSFIQ